MVKNNHFKPKFGKCERFQENWGPVSWWSQILGATSIENTTGSDPCGQPHCILLCLLWPRERGGGGVQGNFKGVPSRGVPVRRPRDGTPPTSHKKTTRLDPSSPRTSRTCWEVGKLPSGRKLLQILGSLAGISAPKKKKYLAPPPHSRQTPSCPPPPPRPHPSLLAFSNEKKTRPPSPPCHPVLPLPLPQAEKK